jgi:hypothetical protein
LDVERYFIGARDLFRVSLSKTWGLGGLIEEAFSGNSPRTEFVKLGYQIARHAPNRWNSEEMRRCIYKMAELTGKRQRHLLTLLRNDAESAVKLAKQSGAHQAAAYIPGMNRELRVKQRHTDERPSCDAASLIQIMQDLTNLLCGEFDLNLILEMTIEGIYRAVGMDRVLVRLVDAGSRTPQGEILPRLATG